MITLRELRKPLEVRSDYDHAVALTVPCRTCGATVGQLCASRSGARWKHHIHMARRTALWAIYTRRKRKSQLITRNYIVEVEFCDEEVRPHIYEEQLTTALGEYVQAAAAALEPERLAPASKHVRQVTLTKLDEDGEVVAKITTPVFGCEHNPAEVMV